MRQVIAHIMAVLLAITGLAALTAVTSGPANAKDVDCSDFSSQSAAQSYFLASGGPSSGPNYLDSDGDGIACETLPCPCSTSTTPTPTIPPVTPPPPPPITASPRTETELKVSAKNTRPDQRVRFKITRLYDPGTGVLAPATGKISLEQKLRGGWKTIQGSRKVAKDGKITLKYYVPGSLLKIRAKSAGPTSYSKVITLR